MRLEADLDELERGTAPAAGGLDRRDPCADVGDDRDGRALVTADPDPAVVLGAHRLEALGVVFGGSGNGEQIAANKVVGARAALVWNLSTASLAREHNDANVISIGARQHTVDEATGFIDAFIAEPFTAEERHVRRIRQLAEYETTRGIAGADITR